MTGGACGLAFVAGREDGGRLPVADVRPSRHTSFHSPRRAHAVRTHRPGSIHPVTCPVLPL